MADMRVLAVILLTLNTGCAQSEQSKVEAVLKQVEHAEQTGDFNAWARLWVPEKSGDLEKMRPYLRARPEVQYRAMKTFVQGDQAVLLVHAALDSFVTMTLRREGGQWKIQDQIWRDTAPDANSVYAWCPPSQACLRAPDRLGSRSLLQEWIPARRFARDGR